MDFNGKVVLITGGSRGIGKAAVMKFASAGATVVFTYLDNEQKAEEVLRSLPPGDHLKIKADIASERESESLVSSVIEKFGRIGILINNAGVYPHHPLDKIDVEGWKKAWDLTMNVNLNGPAHLTYFVARRMILSGGGKIINITSRGAFRGEPEYPAYGASKAGLNSFSQSLAKLLAPYKIYVYAIAPGFVETDMAEPFIHGPDGESVRNQSPLNRAATPDEIVHAIMMVASDGSEYMTGGIIDVNGASYLRT
jgi:3-oxoacyl-[acyl-carrier protein] reductase